MAHGISLHRKEAKIRPPENRGPEQVMAVHHTGGPCKGYGKRQLHRIACLTARRRVFRVQGRALRYKKLLTIFLPLRLMLEAKAFYSPRQKGALPQESIAPERQFLRMASSDFIDIHKGCLRKASLFCIKNCRFRCTAQLWPGSLG